VERALAALDSVSWAEVNAVTGRVVVAFDPDVSGVDELVSVVEGVEEAHGLHHERFGHDRPEHPGDVEPIRRNAIALGADVLGLWVSIFGQVLGMSPLPTEIASLVALAESEPRIRHLLDSRLGPAASDLGLGLANALGQAVSQGPLGLVVDMAHRGSALGELSANRAAWARRELELGARGRNASDPFSRDPRPSPLPRGLVEKWADRASLASLAGFGSVLALSGSPRLAATAFTAGIPKAGRLGREAFASELGRTLAERGVVVMDRSSLRKLDRVDTVLLDASVLATGRARLSGMEAVGGGSNWPEALRQVESLFDPLSPKQIRKAAGWALGPVNAVVASPPAGVLQRAKVLRKGQMAVLGLARRGRLVALLTVEEELDPASLALSDALRRSGLELVVAGTRGSVGRQMGATRTLPGGRRLRDSVRALQASGSVVLLVTRGAGLHQALEAADCSMALTRNGKAIPWGADLIFGEDLSETLVVFEALGEARLVSRQSVALAMAGSGAASVWAVAGLPVTAGRRAALPVNAAALAAQVNGHLRARAVASRRARLPGTVPPWHSMAPEEVIQALQTSPEGLSDAEARRRAEPRAKRPSSAVRLGKALAGELANPLTPLLGLGAGLSAAVGSMTDAALVAGVTGANAAIGAAQRLRAEVSLERLAAAGAALVGVRRGGATLQLGHDRLVMGDVLDLSAGDLVPADCRILESNGCEVDESSLTGESFPVAKRSAATPGAAVADRACMLYEGTTVVAGSALAVVVAAGTATEARRALADAPDPAPSGVEARLSRLGSITVPATVASGAAVTGIGLIRGTPLRSALASGVSLMVAAVPEGLPLLASAAQLSAARRLSGRGALVRNPRTIEALGRVDTLCFDKTGTLTAGSISLQRVSDGVLDEPLEKLGRRTSYVLAAALRASPEAGGNGVLWHATDRAVVEGATEAGMTPGSGVGGWTLLGELAFEPTRGFHAVVGRCRSGAKVAAKGAPEVILPRCATWRSPDGLRRLDGRVRRLLDAEVERLAGRGLRVLAVAERDATRGGELVDERVSRLELLGFVGLADHVRPSAREAIATLKRAGVDVVMITGDHPSTAEAVAGELGILDSKLVISGSDLELMTDEELEQLAGKASVFARVTPAHKVRVVGALQRAGRVVAMTGDGVNDAAAIRLAHAGIALGARGAPAAREAADLVVTDDRLETIVDAIVEGRAMWASVRDALAILLGGNLGEVAFSVATTAIGGSSVLGARQFLLVNLLTDLAPAMTIALRPPPGLTPEELLHEGPDAALGAALGRAVALRAATTASGATGAWLAARATGRRRRASTVALAALVGTQLAQTAIVGRRSPAVMGAAVASGAVLVGIVQTPLVSQFFGCTPLGPIGWSIAASSAGLAVAGSVVLPVMVPAAAKALVAPFEARLPPAFLTNH
jgi:cation-transporting ATPase I